jgi:hypothetical protein
MLMRLNMKSQSTVQPFSYNVDVFKHEVTINCLTLVLQCYAFKREVIVNCLAFDLKC